MNCIITLKINDYFPKIESIPYENFICLFSFEDFKGKIPLSNNDNNNKITHEIPKIISDIKYTIHILEYNSNSLIGMCELLIPLIKLRQISPPCTIIQEQKLKLIIDVNTKRKLFKTLVTSSDIFLFLRAEIFIPNMKCICDSGISKIEVKRKKNNFNENKSMDNSSHMNKKKKLIKDIKSNTQTIKKDFNLNNNKSMNKTINYDNKNNTIDPNKMKLMNDIKNSFKKIDEINLSSKGIKKMKLSQKRSPKKRVTILELMEQKMQPLLLNINDENKMNKENNFNNNIGKTINIKMNKTGKKLKSPKTKKENQNVFNSIDKKSSKKCVTSKNSNEFTSSNNKIMKHNSKRFTHQINQQNDEMNIDINRIAIL